MRLPGNYMITMYSPYLKKEIEMPHDKHIGLLYACHLADVYKEKYKDATYTVYNEINGDVEYQV